MSGAYRRTRRRPIDGGVPVPGRRRPPGPGRGRISLVSVSTPVDPPPVSIPPPTSVRAAAWVAVAQSVIVVVVAVGVIVARQDADLKWALATAAYFVVLAVLIGAVGRGLLQGRRWARTPAIVVQIIFALTGFYLAVPSARVLPGIALIAIGAGTLALLLGKASNDWIRRFPSLFGPAPDR